jgi:hypothetical protein
MKNEILILAPWFFKKESTSVTALGQGLRLQKKTPFHVRKDI